MKLQLVRSLWGITEPWEVSFPRIKASGYTVIECPVPPPSEHTRFRDLLEQHGFDYIAMIFTAGDNVAGHIASFRAQAEGALALRPRLINSHDGRDAWDDAECVKYFKAVLRFEPSLGTPVSHETHRTRAMYNPWITHRLVRRFDTLRLCSDYSHWVVVCERLLDGDGEEIILQECAPRCIHIHARVGYEEGPQVPDPRAPEYQRHLEAHERWWRMMWEAQQARGDKVSTLTPEFGPPPYTPTLPYTKMPMTNLWEICDWIAQREAARFAAYAKTTTTRRKRLSRK